MKTLAARLLAAAIVLPATAAVAAPSARFMLTSPVFEPNGPIPVEFTCNGTDAIVPLRWAAAPAGTKSFALIVDDPDAPVPGGFLHRLAWGMPGTATGLAGKAPVEGTNGLGRTGWIGPCPPSGKHHYIFRLYALKTPLPLKAGAGKAAFEAAVKGRSLGMAKLVGTYGRR